MALRTKGSLVRIRRQRIPQVKVSLKTKGSRNSRLDTNQCPTTKGSLRNVFPLMYVFICDPSPLQSLLPIQTLTIDKWRMKRWNTGFTSEVILIISSCPESISLRRNTAHSRSSLIYWQTEIEKVKYWFQARVILTISTLWNESSIPLYFVFNQIATWSKIRTPLILLSLLPYKTEMKPESPTDFHFY